MNKIKRLMKMERTETEKGYGLIFLTGYVIPWGVKVWQREWFWVWPQLYCTVDLHFSRGPIVPAYVHIT